MINSTKDNNIRPNYLINAYCEETGINWSSDIEWQISIGGICWTIHVLRYLID
ncbi:hypothetical protein MUN88_04335 [Gracilibacillus caseinilyticus]|uniref:Uncharacterized protein n=1 Tax=Gracilibacillus caseinilyticus TaxID=2932256 RepID=A0ABY4EZR2_9BACI|nr:hypothetical protein [Gracilibacillus caseinilyticus]UOQ49353.1 hypothetical protein MUN88_04335 [Gracilibacillus caseinilyticus]